MAGKKGKQQGQRRGKGKSREEKNAKNVGGLARDLLYSGAVADMGWKEEEKMNRCVDMVKSWRKRQEGMRTIQIDTSLEELKETWKGAGKDLVAHFGGGFEDFEVVETVGQEHVAIVDREGVVLGYKKTTDPQNATALALAAEELPAHAPHPRGPAVLATPATGLAMAAPEAAPEAAAAAGPAVLATPANGLVAATGLATAAPGSAPGAPAAPAPGRQNGTCPGSRGVHRVQHLGTWVGYNEDSKPMKTKETRELDEREGRAAEKFLGRIEKLVRDVTNDHRLLEPHEHARALGVAEKMRKKFGIGPGFNGWFGGAVVQGMTGEEASEVHRDRKDFGLTCLVPWGQYTGGNLVLVQLGLKIVLKPGDVFFFRSALIAHQVEEVVGMRGVLTLFTHANVFDNVDRQLALAREKWERLRGGVKFKLRGVKKTGEGLEEYRNWTPLLERKRLAEKEKRRRKRQAQKLRQEAKKNAD